jgi:hypothetical protein
MNDKQKITRAIEDYEYRDNGFKNLSGVDAIAKNVRIKKTENRVYADIILKWYEEGRSERHNDCYYPLTDIQERVKKLEEVGYYGQS